MVEVDKWSAISSEEVDLYPRNAQLAQFRKFSNPRLMREQTILRCLRCIVPIAIAVVPDKNLHVLRRRIRCQFSQLFLSDLLIPQRIDKAISPAISAA